MARQISDDQFQSDVVETSNDRPVLVDFYADWCGPCQAMMPAVEELAKDMEGKADVVKINIEESMQTAQNFGIMSVPTLLVFRNGTVVENFSGIKSKEDLAEVLNKHI